MTQITPRDRILAATIRVGVNKDIFTSDDIKEQIDDEHIPAYSTLNRTLCALTELGIITHKKGSPYYHLNIVIKDKILMDYINDVMGEL